MMDMKKYIYRTVAAAAVALPLSLFTLSSCSDEDQSIPTAIKGQVQFTASVSEAPASRADVAYTPASGNLTIYGNEWLSAIKANYGYNSNTEGWICTSKEPLYWKDITGTSEFVFYAVAPSEPASAPAVLKDQSSMENFTASDLLVARSTVAAKETSVPFVLKHVLSQMEINLTTTEGDEKLTAEELASAVVTIDGLKNAYTLAAGTAAEAPVIATATGDAANGMKPCQDEGKNTFRYITVPQTVTADPGMTLNFTVTLNGKQVKYVYNHKPTFVAGKKNVYHISITKSNLKVSKITVTDWATGTTAEGTALNITVTAQDGTAADIASLSLWNTKDAYKSEYAYTAATGWTAAIPYYIEDYVATDLFFARHTPATADATTGIKDVLGNTTGAAIADGGVALTLEHLMSKLTIGLSRGDKFSSDVDLTGATVTLPGMLPTAEITDANVATATGDAKTYTLSTATAYLFAPQTIAAGTEVTVTLKNGNQYKTTLDKAVEMKQGTDNKLTLTLGATDVAVALTVKDWATGTDAAAALTIVTTGTADQLTDNSTFSTLNLFVDALSGTSFEYTKDENGAWTSTNPLYLDELVATSMLYAQAVSGTADAVTALTDIFGTDVTAVKGGTVAFTFRHLLVQMGIKLVAGTNFNASLEGAVITTPEMFKDYTVATDANRNMTAVAGTDKQAYTIQDADAHLVVPQTLAKGSVFTVKLANGNVYKAALAEAMTLEAGVNTIVTLTLDATEVGVSAAVAAWGETTASATVQLEGIDSQIGISGIADAGTLSLYYVQDGTFTRNAEFGFDGTNWKCTTPLYWDEITPGQQPYTFAALFTPKAGGLVEKDYLIGLGKATAHGQQVQLGKMSHAMAKMKITLKAGHGVTADELTALTKQVNLTKSTKVTVDADGTAVVRLAQESENVSFTDTKEFFVAPQTLGDANIITLTRPNGNKYTVKLTDLHDANNNPIFIDGELKAGVHYSIILTVSETGVGITASIADWTEVSGSGTAKPEF